MVNQLNDQIEEDHEENGINPQDLMQLQEDSSMNQVNDEEAKEEMDNELPEWFEPGPSSQNPE